jgi:hypothetical protein
MVKRLNPHRRLLAKQAAQLRAVRLEQSAVNGADDAKLQQGRVRSPLNTKFSVGYHAPKSVVPSAENMSSRTEGLTGKVQRGKFKWRRPEPAKVPSRQRDWRGMIKPR